MIADLWYSPSRETIVALEKAAVAVASLDVTAGTRMAAISGFLLRSEAVSSSKIEHVDANRDDYARAMIGLKASDERPVDGRGGRRRAGHDRRRRKDRGGAVRSLLTAHHTLMKDDPLDSEVRREDPGRPELDRRQRLLTARSRPRPAPAGPGRRS